MWRPTYMFIPSASSSLALHAPGLSLLVLTPPIPDAADSFSSSACDQIIGQLQEAQGAFQEMRQYLEHTAVTGHLVGLPGARGKTGSGREHGF